MTKATSDSPELVDKLLDGNQRALARVITKIENRSNGYRELVSALHQHTGQADVIGITGSPGSGKSTLVDKITKIFRDQGHSVGIIAIDPSSPFTGGAVLGDRIRMSSNVGDMDVFFRSMSARGNLGGLSAATTDAVKALDAFGKDKIIIETVGAGQNEIDIVKTADTIAVLVPPGSGDDIQMLKAGILEIADIFVVNKADLDGADKIVTELKEMVRQRDDTAATRDEFILSEDPDRPQWSPEILTTIANKDEGINDVIETIEKHQAFLTESGRKAEKRQIRYAEEIKTLLREDVNGLIASKIEAMGGIEELSERVLTKETDPYTLADTIIEPLEECLRQQNQ